MNTILKMIDQKRKKKNVRLIWVWIRKKKGQKHKVAFFIAWFFDYKKKKNVYQNDDKKR